MYYIKKNKKVQYKIEIILNFCYNLYIMEIKYVVKNDTNLVRILKERLSISNRLYKKIKNDCIYVNGSKLRYDTILHENDVITINLDFIEDNSNIIPNKEIKFNILYEDEWLLIIEKSPFMPVHPSINHYENSLSNGIRYYYDTNNIHKKIRITNRLDKDTSGIVIIAKSEYIQENIKVLLKEYIAIAKGEFEIKEGTINRPIKRKNDSIIERCVDENGDNAITNYKVIKTLNVNDGILSVVKCSLETGRTHQIRVHLSSINHPILGDSLYGTKSELINRQALHCYNMKFIHPVTRKEICITSPIPDDMSQIIRMNNL